MKLRRKSGTFLEGNKLVHKFIIEGLYEGKWAPMVIDGEPMRYDTKEERDSALAELKPQVAEL